MTEKSPAEMIVQLTVPELRKLIAEAVTEALDARDGRQKSAALLDQKALGEFLNLSERAIYTMRQVGLPHLMIGDSPRFVAADVLAWLRKSDWQRTVDEMQRVFHAVLNEPEPQTQKPPGNQPDGHAQRNE